MDTGQIKMNILKKDSFNTKTEINPQKKVKEKKKKRWIEPSD